MILNINTFMQKIVNRIFYFVLFQIFIQIAKRFEKFAFVVNFQFQIVNNIQFDQCSKSFYQNFLFMNFDAYQRFFENEFLKFVNIKCLYCFHIDYVFQRDYSIFQKNMTSQKIHVLNRHVYLDSMRLKIFQICI